MPLELRRGTEQTSVQAVVLEFFGLREQPFGPSPNPRFYYPSETHREALGTLISGIENELGFAALIAEPGMGKTMLLFDLVLRYRDKVHTAFVFNTQVNSHELLRHIVSELQIPEGERESDPVRLHQLFTLFVSKNAFAKPVLIIIDEAQNLGDSALETVRLLSDFELPDRKLLHIILAGQPKLGETLRKPTLSQMLQRINTISRLKRYSATEIREYIHHRVRVAGGSGRSLFTPEALARIECESEGVPRAINRLCINALQLGCALRERVVSASVIDEVVDDLELKHESRFDQENLRRLVDQSTNPPMRPEGRPESGHRVSDPILTFTPKPQQTMPPYSPVATKFGTTHQKPATLVERPSWKGGLGQRGLRAQIGNVWQRRSKIPLYAAILVPIAILSIIVTALNYRSSEVRTTLPARTVERTPLPEPVATDRPAPGNNVPDPNLRRERSPASTARTVEVTPARVRGGVKHRPPVALAADEVVPVISNAAPAGLTKRAPVDSDETVSSPPPVPAASDAGDVQHVAESNTRAAPKLAATPTSVLVPGEPINLVRPEYPPQAKTAHIEGDVVLTVNISKEGAVERVRVVGGPPILANAAVAAVSQWRYRPYYLNGSPIPMELNVTVSFRP